MTPPKSKIIVTNDVHTNESGLKVREGIGDTLPMGKVQQKKGRSRKVPAVFSKNFKRLLEEKKITLREAASFAGTSASVISGWVNGATPNDPTAILKLTEALGADYQFILTGKPSNIIPANRIGELFEIEDSPEFTGIFLLEAKRLRWRK